MNKRCVVTEDIVTRLRELREVLMGNPIMAREVQEAMDEIERLRAELDKWRHLARQLYDFIPETSSKAFYRANVLKNYEDKIDTELLYNLISETSSEVFYRANVLANYEDLSEEEFEQEVHGE